MQRDNEMGAGNVSQRILKNISVHRINVLFVSLDFVNVNASSFIIYSYADPWSDLVLTIIQGWLSSFIENRNRSMRSRNKQEYEEYKLTGAWGVEMNRSIWSRNERHIWSINEQEYDV